MIIILSSQILTNPYIEICKVTTKAILTSDIKFKEYLLNKYID